MANKIKRSQIKHYVNTTPTTAATYVLLGLGVTAASEELNPKSTEETYVDQDNATISLDSYAGKLPVEMTAHSDDDVFNYVEGLREVRAIGSAAQTDIVEVRLWQSSSGGGWPATKQNVVVMVEGGPGGEGGVPAKIKFTFGYMGDPTQGYFNPTSKTFA